MICINKKAFAVLAICMAMVLTLTGCDVSWILDRQKQKTEEVSQESIDYKYFVMMHDEGTAALVPYTTQNNLCVTASNVLVEGYLTDGSCRATGLFDVDRTNVLYADSIFDRLYPASTTKLMTALLVLENANLDDVAVVSDSIMNLEPGSQVCGLEPGDSVTIRDLLYGLLLHSGNDNAVVCAEYVAGSVEGFVDMMNARATALLMSGTHFCNPHGLHEDDHYTTAYDLYILMNECIKNETFCEIIDTPSYTGQVTHADGSSEMITWLATNYYYQGLVDSPTNCTIMGGKTGTTDQAGACLVLLARDANGRPYISVILHAMDKGTLYTKMTQLLYLIPAA